MKKLLLLFLLSIVAMVSTNAETIYFGQNKQSVIEKNGTTVTVTLANAGDISSDKMNPYWDGAEDYAASLAIKDAKQLTISGPMNDSDFSKIKDWNAGSERLDLSEVTGISLASWNGNYSILILPAGSTVSDVPSNCKYVIVKDDPLKVVVQQGHDWVNDPLVEAAEEIEVKTSSNPNPWDLDITADITALRESHVVNGEGNGGSDNITIEKTDAKGGDVAALISENSDKTIVGIIVSGEMNSTDYDAIAALNKVKTIDFSGVTSGLDGMKFPSSAKDIKLPGGVSYKNGTVSIDSNTTMEQLKQALSVLKDNGKTFTSVPLPGGGTWENGVISGVSDGNIAEVASKLKEAGLSVNAIYFASGSKFVSGKLTTVAADDDTADHLKAKADIVRSALGNDAITSLTMSDKTNWASDGSVTISDEDQKDAIIAKLNNAGFTVDDSKVTVNSVSGNYVTLSKGVVTLTLPSGMSVAQAIQNMTDEEKNALKENNDWKLVGSFTADDIYKLAEQNDHITGLDLSEAHLPENYKFDRWKDKIESLTLPGDPSYTTIPEEFFNGSNSLKSITIPTNIKTIGAKAFQYCRNLATITFTPESSVETLGEKCFQGTAITTVEIPGSVKSIETHAFSECNNLTSVVFAEKTDEDGNSVVDMNIANKAFENSKAIKDVYVETLGHITCANEAFSFDITYAHGDPSADYATLHFPGENAEDYANLEEDYGLDYETAKDPGEFHRWLRKRYERALDKPNGWWEFVNNGPINGADQGVPGGKFLKTFSDYKYSYIVPAGVKAYIVNGVKYENGAYKLSLMSLNVIPYRTGVILYGETNSHTKTGEPTLTLSVTNLKDGLPLVRDVDNNDWGYLKDTDNKDGGEGLRNYLVPTATEDGKGVQVTPFEPYGTSAPVEFRNFGLGWFSKTESYKKYKKEYSVEPDDFIGFFRLKSGKMGNGKAYLRLRANEYQNSEGMEAIVVKDDNYRREYKAEGDNVRVMTDDELKNGDLWQTAVWDTDWGVRNLNANFQPAKFNGEPFFQEHDDDTATLIIPAEMVEIEDNGEWYTLQGVKVDQPTQRGIYIRNGKKIVIK